MGGAAQIRGFLEAAWQVAGLRLNRLTHLALYAHTEYLGPPDHPFDPQDPPVEHFVWGAPLGRGAQGVCDAVGGLVAAGVLPALSQAGPLWPHGAPPAAAKPQTPIPKAHQHISIIDPYDAIITPVSLLYLPRRRSATVHCAASAVSEASSGLGPCFSRCPSVETELRGSGAEV